MKSELDMKRISVVIPVIFFVLLVLSCAPAGVKPKDTVSARKQWKETPEVVEETPVFRVRNIIRSNFEKDYSNSHIVLGNTRVKTSDYLKSIYLKNDYFPLWFDNRGVSVNIELLPSLITSSYDEGLEPDDYNPELIKRLVSEYRDFDGISEDTDLKTISAVDLILSNTVLMIAGDVYYGKKDVSHIYNNGIRSEDHFDLVAHVKDTVVSGDLDVLLEPLEPKSVIYRSLIGHLQRYRDIKSKGGWPSIPSVYSKLVKGDRDPRILVIKERLLITGDLKSKYGNSYMNDDLFDQALFEAVKHFQRRHGLQEDGIVGSNTLKAMNQPIDKKIEIIKLNLDLWRRLPRDLGDRYIMVNVPGFHLYGFQKGRIALDMKVVVGRSDWNTPVFQDQMTYVVINPYWNVPSSIFRDEMLPELRKDPAYLQKQNISIITSWDDDAIPLDPMLINWSEFNPDNWQIRLRQEPGPSNPLGRLKFMFPNKHNVYLHDTPMKSLFNRLNRQFSHGCIRVERPLDLAEFVFNGRDSWNKNKIIDEINTGVSKQVPLPEPVPIYILYFTAWVDNDGSVMFFDDVYNMTGT